MFPSMSHSFVRIAFVLTVLLSSVTSFISLSVQPSSRISSSTLCIMNMQQPLSSIDIARQQLRVQAGRVAVFATTALLAAGKPSTAFAIGSGGLTEANEKLG